jgi:hypothetical protein
MSLLKKAVLLAFLLTPFFACAQDIPASDASRHMGEQGTVCGRLAGLKIARTVRGTPTFIDFDKPYPPQVFTAVVWKRDIATVGNIPRVGVLCVTGSITEYRGRPQIVLHTASDWMIPGIHFSKPPEPIKRQATLSNDKHYTNSDGVVVHSPAYLPSGIPVGATAQCEDGSYSFSTHRQGTCSHHGGVAKWF